MERARNETDVTYHEKLISEFTETLKMFRQESAFFTDVVDQFVGTKPEPSGDLPIWAPPSKIFYWDMNSLNAELRSIYQQFVNNRQRLLGN